MNKVKSLTILIFSIIIICSIISCTEKKVEHPFPADKNPWFSIKKERIQKLLPDAMKIAGVDLWMVICRENNNDPLATHVGGENSGGTAAFLFFLKDNKVESIAISPRGEAKALQEIGLLDKYVIIDRRQGIWKVIAEQIEKADPNRIAINSSNYSIADGLS